MRNEVVCKVMTYVGRGGYVEGESLNKAGMNSAKVKKKKKGDDTGNCYWERKGWAWQRGG